LSLADRLTMAVGVDVEGHLDLRHAGGRGPGGMPIQVEMAEHLLVGRHFSPLCPGRTADVNRRCWLIPRRSRLPWLFFPPRGIVVVLAGSMMAGDPPPKRLAAPATAGSSRAAATFLTSPAARRPGSPRRKNRQRISVRALKPVCGSLPNNLLHHFLKPFGMRVIWHADQARPRRFRQGGQNRPSFQRLAAGFDRLFCTGVVGT